MRLWMRIVVVASLAYLFIGCGDTGTNITALAELADARRNETTAGECSAAVNVGGNNNAVTINICSDEEADAMADVTFGCKNADGDSAGDCSWHPPDRPYVLAAFSDDGRRAEKFCERSPCQLDPAHDDPPTKRWEFVLLDEDGNEVTDRIPLDLKT